MLSIGALAPARGWAQEPSAGFVTLPLVALEERGAPAALDCPVLDPNAPLPLLDPENSLPAPACAGAPFGFSATGGFGSRFGWFGALGNYRYLAALPALLLLGGGGGGGGGVGGDAQHVGHEGESQHEGRPPYQTPVPEPISTVLLLSGAGMVAGAVRRRRP